MNQRVRTRRVSLKKKKNDELNVLHVQISDVLHMSLLSCLPRLVTNFIKRFQNFAQLLPLQRAAARSCSISSQFSCLFTRKFLRANLTDSLVGNAWCLQYSGSLGGYRKQFFKKFLADPELRAIVHVRHFVALLSLIKILKIQFENFVSKNRSVVATELIQ